MEKIDILIKGLSDQERSDVLRLLKNEGVEVEIFDYIEKSFEGEEIIKFIFTDFNIWYWMRDAVLSGIFVGVIKSIRGYLAIHKPNAKKQIIFLYKKTTLALPDNEVFVERMVIQLPTALKRMDPEKSNRITYSEETQSIHISDL